MADLYKTPTPTSTPVGTATQRPGFDATGLTPEQTLQALQQWMTNKHRTDPSYQIPAGFSADENGNITHDQPAWLLRHPWLIPLMGIGAGFAIRGAMAVAGAGAGAGGAGAGGAAAGTGAALSTTGKILGTAGAVGDFAARLAGNRAAARNDAGIANQNQALAQASLFRTRMDAALKGPRAGAQDAVFGDTLANVQPFKWTGGTQQVGNIPVPQSTGGLGPQNFGPNTRQAGRDLSALGASRVNSPSFNLPDAPTLPDLPRAGTGDSILNNAGTYLSLISGLGGLYTGKYKSPKVTAPGEDTNSGYMDNMYG